LRGECDHKQKKPNLKPKSMISHLTLLLLLLVSITEICGFVPLSRSSSSRHISSSRSRQTSATFAKRGFSKPTNEPLKEKSEGQLQRESRANKYEELASTGGQAYNIFVREFGEDEKSWYPCGSVAVPRGAQVSDAIYANIDELKASIVRDFKNLKGMEDSFEFGFNLKIFPDDPVEVAKRDMTNKVDKLNPMNWLSTLLSPVDVSKFKE